MKQSLRAKRMAKHHRRLSQPATLSLVSLMDVFTVLVFFLLLNTGDVEVLQADKTIKLPASFSEQVPEENLVVLIGATDILVGGRPVGRLADVEATEGDRFAPLEQELRYVAQKAGALTEAEKKAGRAATIMADQKIPYHLLKKIIATCAAADYRDISLAVSKKEKPLNDLGEG